jgi:dUTP pyrophosphatase
MEVNIKFAKVRPEGIIPSKRDEDMGFDIYACFDEDYIVISPHETKLIPTGIASACDPGYGFLLFERGSTGSKGIARRCGVIDSGYRDEWFVGLTNTTERSLVISKLNKIETAMRMCNAYNEEELMMSEDEIDECILLYPYSKAIVQALIVPVPKVNREETSYEELKAIPSERGLGALGSSGK